MYTEEKPDLEELAHFGVLGMKWGKTRAKATSADVRAARSRVRGTKMKIEKQQSKINTLKGKGKATKAEEQSLAKMKNDFLKNPDRVISARMTRGEKAATALLASLTGAGASTGAGAPVSA